MATAQQQARWRARHRESYNRYMRERYRRLHPLKVRAPLTLKQKLALADMRALGGWNQAERSVTEKDLRSD